MVTRQSHTNVYVLDQDEALKFYREILGMEIRTDMTLENGFRWVTVGPKSQPDLELILMAVQPGPAMSEEVAAQLQDLLKKGVLSFGVLESDDVRRDHAEWSAKGVQFIQPPKEQFYGLEALVRDNSGNWFSLTERKK